MQMLLTQKWFQQGRFILCTQIYATLVAHNPLQTTQIDYCGGVLFLLRILLMLQYHGINYCELV